MRSKSPTSSSGDTGAHLLLQLLQGAAQARRARGRADPEHSRRHLAVQLEHYPQRDDLPLGRREPRERLLEPRGQPFPANRPGVLSLLGGGEAALAPAAAVLGAKVVERGRARELAEPRASRPAARVEAPPALQRPRECL